MNLEHLFITNGNIFLPLSNLTQAQRLMLDPETGPALLAQATPEQLAVGMGQATYTPPRGADDPEVAGARPRSSRTARASRSCTRRSSTWSSDPRTRTRGCEALAALDVPTTFIWGVYDTVSPPRVVSYVWNEFMMKKPGRNSLYFVPDANHYLQNDRPDRPRRDVPARARSARRHAPGAIAPRRRRRCWSTARDPSCHELRIS